MGTTLTGTTPQDTYDSLIKVTDNGPLSGTAKYLSDGLGNDSILALSTAAVGVGLNSPSSGRLQVRGSGTTSGTNAFFVDNSVGAATFAIRDNGDAFLLGNVGIGTSSPVYKLQINASGGNGISLLGDVDNEASVLFGDSGSAVIGRLTYNNVDDSMRIFTNGTEKVRILSGGGITFNGDTAAANALDDYEEGTWTPTDQSGAGLTFAAASGNYTKIGREVSYRAVIIYPSTADVNLVEIGGLPFTVPNNNQSRGGYVTYSTASVLSYAITIQNSTKVGLTDNTGTSLTNVQLTGAVIFIGGSYNV
jgi:hypothetical protein